MGFILRAIEKEDLPQLRDWRNDFNIRVRTREHRLLSMANQYKWFDSLRDDKNTVMFAIEVGDTLIGVCGLCYIDWVDRTAELSIYIGDENYAGKGLGKQIVKMLLSKAFENLNLNKVWLECFSFNEQGIRLFKSCNFIEEGRLRKHIYRMGEYHDSIMMSVLKEEFCP